MPMSIVVNIQQAFWWQLIFEKDLSKKMETNFTCEICDQGFSTNGNKKGQNIILWLVV